MQVGPAPEANLAPDESYGSTLAIGGLDDEDDFATEDGNSTAPTVYETGVSNFPSNFGGSLLTLDRTRTLGTRKQTKNPKPQLDLRMPRKLLVKWVA